MHKREASPHLRGRAITVYLVILLTIIITNQIVIHPSFASASSSSATSVEQTSASQPANGEGGETGTETADLDADLDVPPPRPTIIMAPDAPDLKLTTAQVTTAWLVYDILHEAGDLSPEQIAGFIGNFYRESSLNPTAVNKKRTHYGLAQWGGSRWRALRSWAEHHKTETQMQFLLSELSGTESKANTKIRAAETVQDAAIAIAKHYERCALPEAEKKIRIKYAQSFYDQMGLGTPNVD